MGEPNHATVGCTFSRDEDAVEAMRSLSEAGLASDWRIGATDGGRAERVAQSTGARADLDRDDPLRGIAGLASGADAQRGVNAGALMGAVIGAAAGLALGWTPLAAIVPVDPHLRVTAMTLLLFTVGAALGGVLGGAFGKRPSTHAGFRLIDAMEAGEIAAIASIDPVQAQDVRAALERAKATDVIVIAS